MSKRQTWTIVATVCIAIGLVWRLTKFLIILWRISFPKTTTPTPAYSYHSDVTLPRLNFNADWLAPPIGNLPHLNISNEDLHKDFELLNKYQKSNSDEDFWKLIKTLQKQQGISTEKAVLDYSEKNLKNSTHSNNTVQWRDRVPSNNSAQFEDVANTNEGAGSHDPLWSNSTSWSHDKDPSNKLLRLNETVSSPNNTTKLENPLQSNDTAQSITPAQSNNTTWLFHKLLPASQIKISQKVE